MAASLDFSDGLEELIHKMLRKNSLERYQDMERLVQDLERLEQGLPIGFVATTGFESSPKAVEMATRQVSGPSLRIWILVIVLILGFMMFAGIGAYWLLRLPAVSSQKAMPVYNDLGRMPISEGDSEPVFYFNYDVLSIRPGVNLNDLRALSRRGFAGIVFEGTVKEDRWSEIFTAMKSLKGLNLSKSLT